MSVCIYSQGQGSDTGVFMGVDSFTEKSQDNKKRQRSPRGDTMGELEHQDKRSKEEKKQEFQKAQDNGQQEEAFKNWLKGLKQRREVKMLFMFTSTFSTVCRRKEFCNFASHQQ